MDYDKYIDSQIGIYKITNKLNGKVYIGQSWDIPARFRQHRNTHDNMNIHKSITLDGLSNFTFEVIKEIEAHPTLTQILLDIYEKKFIVLYHSNNPEYGYNLTKGGGNGLRSPDVGLKISLSQKGRKRSEETKEKLRMAWVIRRTRKESLETRKLKSLALKGNHYAPSRAVLCIETGIIYPSINGVAKNLHIGQAHIVSVCKHDRVTAGGFHWEYAQK